ncbi:hypothetical protein [Sporolactobacillus pectinivorans]|nr:hypothetical protein [Sporolactobacillus pectinivorans]
MIQGTIYLIGFVMAVHLNRGMGTVYMSKFAELTVFITSETDGGM